MVFRDVSHAIRSTKDRLYYHGTKFQGKEWQSVEAPDAMWELLDVDIKFPIGCIEDSMLKCKANQPWAEDHLRERVGGQPLNPGREYSNWPFYKKKKENDKFRTVGEEQFSHTYMERIWPKHANDQLNLGIRYKLGDLRDLINTLKADPTTRQAYLPIWFPEDTGAINTHGNRVPCTLGYFFIIRGDYIHMSYYIRSCDYLRHFRDDIYLALGLLDYIIKEINLPVKPGRFKMIIENLHCFYSEKEVLKQNNK